MKKVIAAVAIACVVPGWALGQSLATSQPKLLQIYLEEVKVGHVAEHVQTEAGWPAAYEKANSPDYYLALESVTGPNRVWFVAPFESHEALGESMKRERDDPILSSELAKLSREDSENLTGARSIQAVALKDLSYGTFPDMATQRYWQITTFRVRPGHEMSFIGAAKAYGTAAARLAPEERYRIYQVVAGLPDANFLVFSSFRSFANLDEAMAMHRKILSGLNAEERAAFDKFAEGVISTETERFRLSPEMSYVSKEVRQQDPAFWNPRKTEPIPTTGP